MENNNNNETGLTVNQPEQSGIQVQTFATVISANSSKMSEMIMSNIEKLQSDPKFIPQAEAINSQLKSMIDLGKAEIEAYKVAAFMSSQK